MVMILEFQAFFEDGEMIGVREQAIDILASSTSAHIRHTEILCSMCYV